MSDASSVVRSLLIYGICLPLAIFLGYLLATPMDAMSFAMLGVLFGVLSIPIFLRWHYPWLFAFWNANMLAFFLPGKPAFSMVLCVVSLGISILHHILNKRYRFLNVPTVGWSLIFLALVVWVTARLTGGVSLQITGGQNFGGKKYLTVFVAIIGYFAMTARPIPPQKVKLYVRLFFLGALTSAMANVAGVVSPSLYFLFAIFPVDPASLGGSEVLGEEGIARFAGLSSAALAVISVLIAFYGIDGLFKKFWRAGLLALCFVGVMVSGFRGHLITFLLICCISFYMEGLFRSRLVPMLVLTSILLGAVFLPMMDKLPLGVQRTMSFLPLPLDPVVVADAKDSTDWRIDMWKTVLPEIPQHLILGKGYLFDPEEMEMLRLGISRGEGASAGSALAGDYHNGPLTVLLTFGVFGVIGFVWFLVASIKLLRANYRYGDPSLLSINRFLYTLFVAKTIFFLAVFGSFHSDFTFFTGLVALSVCINGGMCRAPAPAAPQKPLMINRLKLANAGAGGIQ